MGAMKDIELSFKEDLKKNLKKVNQRASDLLNSDWWEKKGAVCYQASPDAWNGVFFEFINSLMHAYATVRDFQFFLETLEKFSVGGNITDEAVASCRAYGAERAVKAQLKYVDRHAEKLARKQ